MSIEKSTCRMCMGVGSFTSQASGIGGPGNATMDCPQCGGAGLVPINCENRAGILVPAKRRCRRCSGVGSFVERDTSRAIAVDQRVPCELCSGTGRASDAPQHADAKDLEHALDAIKPAEHIAPARLHRYRCSACLGRGTRVPYEGGLTRCGKCQGTGLSEPPFGKGVDPTKHGLPVGDPNAIQRPLTEHALDEIIDAATQELAKPDTHVKPDAYVTKEQADEYMRERRPHRPWCVTGNHRWKTVAISSAGVHKGRCMDCSATSVSSGTFRDGMKDCEHEWGGPTFGMLGMRACKLCGHSEPRLEIEIPDHTHVLCDHEWGPFSRIDSERVRRTCTKCASMSAEPAPDSVCPRCESGWSDYRPTMVDDSWTRKCAECHHGQDRPLQNMIDTDPDFAERCRLGGIEPMIKIPEPEHARIVLGPTEDEFRVYASDGTDITDVLNVESVEVLAKAHELTRVKLTVYCKAEIKCVEHMIDLRRQLYGDAEPAREDFTPEERWCRDTGLDLSYTLPRKAFESVERWQGRCISEEKERRR